MQVKKKSRNAATKKIQKAPPKEKRTKKERTEQPLLKRVIFGEERPDLTELEAGSTTILDILAPTTVDTKSKDYIVVDGVYHTYLYITGYGYATTVGSCWLAPLVEAGEGVNMSFLVKRQSKEKILSKIAQTTMVNRSRMRDVGDTRQDYEELDSAINSGLYLKDVMNRQGEDFYYMHTLIEVTAPDPETLEQRATEVEKLCVSVDMIARRCDYKNEQAFLSSLPILALDPDIERKARRNALTSGVAAAFPFASYELSDHNGIFLGLNLYNRSPVFLDPYDDYKYTNGNWWIGGSTGAGKTVTLQCLGGRLRQQGKRVIIIAPKKGHEFRPLCEKLGGLYLRMSPSSKDCPNLMAIRRKSLDSYAKLKNIAARDDSVLADKISQLIIWFALKKKDLSEEDKSRLDSSLVEVYGRYRGLHYPVHLLSCDETGARQLQIMAVPDYRVKLAKLMLRSAYRPPPEDAPAWDAIYQNRPFVIGADMNLRRIDAAIASAKKRGCLPISLAALDAQGDAVLLRRYKDTGYAVIYKVTESVLTELFGRPPSLYLPPCTQYLTKKGAVVDAPLIQVDRKDRGSPRK